MDEKTCQGGAAPGKSGLLRVKKEGIKKIIAVGSGKGGVGKSSIASLLAVALARQGNKVGILDADITGPSIPKLMGVSGKLYGTESGIIPPATKELGIKIMSVNLLLDDPSKPVVWRGPLIGGVIKQFWDEVDWGILDYLIIDLPPGTSDAPLTVMQTIDLDGFLLVTSPQELSVLVVEKAANMTGMMDVPLLGVIENMSCAVCPHCGESFEIFGPSHVEDIEKKFNIPVIARVPINSKIAALGDAGQLEKYEDGKLYGQMLEGLERQLIKK